MSQMREIQVGFGVANEGDLVSEMRGLPKNRAAPLVTYTTKHHPAEQPRKTHKSVGSTQAASSVFSLLLLAGTI